MYGLYTSFIPVNNGLIKYKLNNSSWINWKENKCKLIKSIACNWIGALNNNCDGFAFFSTGNIEIYSISYRRCSIWKCIFVHYYWQLFVFTSIFLNIQNTYDITALWNFINACCNHSLIDSLKCVICVCIRLKREWRLFRGDCKCYIGKS